MISFCSIGRKSASCKEEGQQVSARDLSDYKAKLIEEIFTLDFTNIETKVWDATVLDPDMTGYDVASDLCSGLPA